MNPSSLLTIRVFEHLNMNTTYAVLRNYEGLPATNTSRDIDILIEKEVFVREIDKIVAIISELEFKIITYYASEKLWTLICASCSNGNADIVQFDFFFNISLFGLDLLDTRSVLDSRSFNGAIYHVSKAFEFLDKYLQVKFLDAKYPHKYKALKEEIKIGGEVDKILSSTFGINSLAELEVISSSQFRKLVWQRNIRQPFHLLSTLPKFIYYYILNLFYVRGFSLSFTGPDGSGKTTVINAIELELQKVYAKPVLFHFRPTLFPNLGEAAHTVKLKQEPDRDFSSPHRGGKTGKVSSFIRLIYYTTDYVVGYFAKVRPHLHKRNIVIFDRYYTDVVADSRRSRIFLNHKFLYRFGRLFIPEIDYNILLTADADVILARKQELNRKGIEDINAKLTYLSNKKGYHWVMNNGKQNEAVNKILTNIFDQQHNKILSRL